VTATIEEAAAREKPVWALQTPPADYVLGNVRAVLPDTVIDDAHVVVRDGRIAEVLPSSGARVPDVDGGGLHVVPGLVDVHSDGLEKERLPRPGVPLPWMFSMASFEGKIRAAGITTVFHGASFSDRQTAKNERSVLMAEEMCEAIEAWNARDVDERLVDHHILHRLDVRSQPGLDSLRGYIEKRVDNGFFNADHPAVISHEDHTPGIGQYADRTFFETYVKAMQGVSEEDARAHVDLIAAEREANIGVREESMAWLHDRSMGGIARVFGHDPESAVEIADLAARGGNVAEFPTTIEAAREAVARGMSVIMGGPNIIRGGSHSGNVSAEELASLGVVTALASDYLPSSLMGAAFSLAERNILSLPEAVGLVTSGPAKAVGLHDRGSLVEGQRADLVLVSIEHGCPVIRSVLRAQ
jgi:alpha-D-ribose 1-methylphosphonate 5-triphosphate diphosphatase